MFAQNLNYFDYLISRDGFRLFIAKSELLRSKSQSIISSEYRKMRDLIGEKNAH